MGKQITQQLGEWAGLTPSTLGTLCFLFMRGSVFLTYKIASWINFSEIRNGTSAFFPEADDIWMPGFISILAPICVTCLPFSFIFTVGNLKAAHCFPRGSQALRAGLSTVLSPIHLVELTGVLPMLVMTLCKNSLISQSNRYYTTQGWHHGALVMKLTFLSPYQLLFLPWDRRDWTQQWTISVKALDSETGKVNLSFTVTVDAARQELMRKVVITDWLPRWAALY